MLGVLARPVRLTAHDVLRFGEVAKHVEVLQAAELVGQLSASVRVAALLASLRGDRVENALSQVGVELERPQPIRELAL